MTSSEVPSRFSYDAPNIFGVIWRIIKYRDDWRRRCNAVITDHKNGTRFQLEDDEEAVMARLADQMAEVGRIRDWTPVNIDLVRDAVLAAICEKRLGNLRSWSRFAAMKPHEWETWIRRVTGIAN